MSSTQFCSYLYPIIHPHPPLSILQAHHLCNPDGIRRLTMFIQKINRCPNLNKLSVPFNFPSRCHCFQSVCIIMIRMHSKTPKHMVKVFNSETLSHIPQTRINFLNKNLLISKAHVRPYPSISSPKKSSNSGKYTTLKAKSHLPSRMSKFPGAFV